MFAMVGARLEKKAWLAVVLMCLLAARASASPTDGQYEAVGNNRFCNRAGDCYTKEYLPSGVLRYCRDGGGCRYMSAAQSVACPRGYAPSESGSCRAVRPRPTQGAPQHSGRERTGQSDNRRDRQRQTS